jgi:hypothetical protein
MFKQKKRGSMKTNYTQIPLLLTLCCITNALPAANATSNSYQQLLPIDYLPATTKLANKQLTYTEQDTYSMIQQLTQALEELQKKPELQQAVIDIFTATKKNLTTLDTKNKNNAYVSWFVNIVDLLGKLTGIIINQQSGEITFVKDIQTSVRPKN